MCSIKFIDLFLITVGVCCAIEVLDENQQCGQRIGFEAYIYNGKLTKKDEWPWLVGFVYQEYNSLFCGGSLISKKHVLSAAHCFQYKGHRKKIRPHYISAWLGKYDLSTDVEFGSKLAKVWDIILHPDWDFNVEKYEADISMVVLQEDVEFSNQIQPVCLPAPSYDEVVGNGIVVGWGESESSGRNAETKPRKVEIPAINSSFCYTRFPKLASFSSVHAFCGGYDGKGTAPCLGDSGSGFYLLDTTSSTWSVRGIVSGAIKDPIYGCDVNKYTLYTNVARFIDWIIVVVEETKKISWKAVEFICKGSESSTYGDYDTNCQQSYDGPESRNLKIQPDFSNHSEFAGPDQVVTLEIDFQPSRHLYVGIGKTFPNLRKLRIEESTVEYLERGDFADMEKLEELDFYDNRIKYLPDEVFWDLPNLTLLKLRENQIEELSKKLFTNTKKIKSLDLCKNKLTEFDADVIKSLPQLQWIDLSENRIEIQMTEAWNLPNLESLLLKYCRIEVLPPNFLKNMPKLVQLFLFSNKLTHLDKDLFKHNPQMEWIDFAENNLMSIGIDFTKLKNIKDVLVSGCVSGRFNAVSYNSDFSSLQEFQNQVNEKCRKI